MQPATLKIMLKYMVESNPYHKEANFLNTRNRNIEKFDALIMATSDISKEFLNSDDEIRKFLSKLENKAKDRKPRANSYFAFLLLLKALRALDSKGFAASEEVFQVITTFGVPMKLSEVYSAIRTYTVVLKSYNKRYKDEKDKKSAAETPEEKEKHQIEMEKYATKYNQMRSELPTLIENVKDLVEKIIKTIKMGSEPKEDSEED